jgi:hypothetical protein
MTSTSTRRRAGAGVAVSALIGSALLFTPSAQAADTITNVRESEIAPTEATYAGWHQGAEGGKYQVGNDGLELILGAAVPVAPSVSMKIGAWKVAAPALAVNLAASS